jgi:chemotaxis protein MotB
LDADNRQLTSQVAQLQQQNQALLSQKELLAQQLQDSVNQYKQLASTSQQYADQARGMQASMSARGGARLTANNSLQSSASGIVISGAQVVPDGQVIRIRLPADRIFTPGSAVLTAEGTRQLDEVASVITQRFARQRVAVEGHTDSGQVYGGFGTPYKLAGEQAQTVMDQLVQRNRLPTQQLFVVAHGPNHPVADNRTDYGRSANRRIEIVVYPDSF